MICSTSQSRCQTQELNPDRSVWTRKSWWFYDRPLDHHLFEQICPPPPPLTDRVFTAPPGIIMWHNEVDFLPLESVSIPKSERLGCNCKCKFYLQSPLQSSSLPVLSLPRIELSTIILVFHYKQWRTVEGSSKFQQALPGFLCDSVNICWIWINE